MKISNYLQILITALLLILCGCNMNMTQVLTPKLEWQHSIFGNKIGFKGLYVTEPNKEGMNEIVATATCEDFSSSYWYVAQSDSSGGYKQVWHSPVYPLLIVRLIRIDVTKDGIKDFVVALEDGTVYIYDGANYKQIRKITFEMFNPGLVTIAVADIDNDGFNEVIGTDSIGLYLYSAQTGLPLWNTANEGGGSSLAVGNVDNDSALEIVGSSSPTTGYVTDGVTHSVEWKLSSGFGGEVALGDIDGDGIDEIIGETNWTYVAIFDAIHHTLKSEIPTDGAVGSLLVQNISGDALPEILVADVQWGSIHAIDPRSKSELWSIPNPGFHVGNLAWGDTDADGKPEIVWGSGDGFAEKNLFIGSPQTLQIKWQNIDIGGPLSAQDIGDIDGDGKDEIVMASFDSNNHFSPGVLHCFDATTHALKWQTAIETGSVIGIRTVKIADIDNDGTKEIVVTTGGVYSGELSIYEGKTHFLKAKTASYDRNLFSAIAIGDVDGDGKNEIIGGVGQFSGNGAYLVVFDGITLQEKWRSSQFLYGYEGIFDIRLADINGNGIADILASIPESTKVIAIDGITHNQLWQTDSPAYALEVANIDGYSAKEILVGRADGKIDVYSSVDFSLKQTISTPSTKPIYALHVEDTNHDGQLDWLMTSGDTIYALDPAHPETALWQQGGLSEHLGWHNQMVVKDINHDGSMKLVVGSDVALYQFGL